MITFWEWNSAPNGILTPSRSTTLRIEAWAKVSGEGKEFGVVIPGGKKKQLPGLIRTVAAKVPLSLSTIEHI